MPERNFSTDADHLSLNEDYSKLLSFPFVRTPVQQVLLSYPLHYKILRTNSKIYFGIARVLFYIFEVPVLQKKVVLHNRQQKPTHQNVPKLNLERTFHIQSYLYKDLILYLATILVLVDNNMRISSLDILHRTWYIL